MWAEGWAPGLGSLVWSHVGSCLVGAVFEVLPLQLLSNKKNGQTTSLRPFLLLIAVPFKCSGNDG